MGKDNPLISVIVPVYNVEEYLARCLDSILQQTYSNLEILVVDDGSTDRSGEICDEYQKKDDRIKVFHKKNEGLAETRNYAIRHASGDYIACVDSDDYIEKDMYETLVAYMDDLTDITTCGMNYIFPRNVRLSNHVSYRCYKPQIFENREAVRELLLERNFSFSSCDKLFRKELFENVRYPKGKVNEDIPVIYQLFTKAGRIINTGTAKYNYIFREDSISRRSFYRQMLSYSSFARDIEKDVEKRYPELRKVAEVTFLNHVAVNLNNLVDSKEREKYAFLERRLRWILRKRIFRILLNESISGDRKKYFYQLIFERNGSVGKGERNVRNR